MSKLDFPKIENGFTRASTRLHDTLPALKSITAALAVVALGGCAFLPQGTSIEALVGTKITDGGFVGPTGPTATFRIRHRLTDNTWCEYEHVSHVFAGPPFGPRNEEDWLDQVGCGIRFGSD